MRGRGSSSPFRPLDLQPGSIERLAFDVARADPKGPSHPIHLLLLGRGEGVRVVRFQVTDILLRLLGGRVGRGGL